MFCCVLLSLQGLESDNELLRERITQHSRSRPLGRGAGTTVICLETKQKVNYCPPSVKQALPQVERAPHSCTCI